MEYIVFLCLKPLYCPTASCYTQPFSPQDPQCCGHPWISGAALQGEATVSLLLPPCEAIPGTCPAPAQLFQRPALPKHSGQDRLCCFCQEEGTCIKMAVWQPWLSPHHHLKQLQLLPGGRGGECTAHCSQAPSLPGSCIC